MIRENEATLGECRIEMKNRERRMEMEIRGLEIKSLKVVCELSSMNITSNY